MKKEKRITTTDLVMMQVKIDPGATCARVIRALTILYWPRRFDGPAVSSVLNRMTKVGALVRIPNVGPRGGDGFIAADVKIVL